MGQVRSKFFAVSGSLSDAEGKRRDRSSEFPVTTILDRTLTSKPQFDTCKPFTHQHGLSATISEGYTHDNYAFAKTGHLLQHQFELN